MTTFVEKSGRIYFDKIAYQRRFFNRFSTSYWFLNIFSFGLANQARRRSLAELRIREGGIVCDLMCGDGSNIGILRKYYRWKDHRGRHIRSNDSMCAESFRGIGYGLFDRKYSFFLRSIRFLRCGQLHFRIKNFTSRANGHSYLRVGSDFKIFRHICFY